MNALAFARPWRGALAVIVLSGAALLLGGSVLASHVVVEPSFPDGMNLGQPVEVPIALHDNAGQPVPGTAVVFYQHASFAGVSGEIVVGRGVTDGDGVATLTYRPRQAGHHEIRVEYLSPGEGEPELATTTIDVAGAAQLYRSSPGIEVPGLNVGLLMAVLTTVWSILFGVAVLLISIARAGAESLTPGLAEAR